MLSQCLRIQAEIISKCFGYKKSEKKHPQMRVFFCLKVKNCAAILPPITNKKITILMKNNNILSYTQNRPIFMQITLCKY